MYIWHEWDGLPHSNICCILKRKPKSVNENKIATLTKFQKLYFWSNFEALNLLICAILNLISLLKLVDVSCGYNFNIEWLDQLCTVLRSFVCFKHGGKFWRQLWLSELLPSSETCRHAVDEFCRDTTSPYMHQCRSPLPHPFIQFIQANNRPLSFLFSCSCSLSPCVSFCSSRAQVIPP